eukprot:8958064-Pyramimonas_sp.AAC.1
MAYLCETGDVVIGNPEWNRVAGEMLHVYLEATSSTAPDVSAYPAHEKCQAIAAIALASGHTWVSLSERTISRCATL